MLVSLAIIVLPTLVGIVQGFSTGAPLGSCLTFFPKHDHVDKQMCASPYWIELSAPSFRPSQEINVTLMAPNGQTFIGFMLSVHREAGDTEERLGSFVKIFDDTTKASSCIGGKDNMVTQKDNSRRKNVVVTWKAPGYEVGNVTFRAAFVKTFHIFWTDVTTHLPSQTYTEQSIVNKILSEPVHVNYGDCGKTMGCLLYPKYCSGSDCDVGLTYTMNNESNTFTFWARTEIQSYVSLGFSDDRLMGKDETISCTYDGNIVSFQHGNNPSYHNQRQYKKDKLSNMASTYTDDTTVIGQHKELPVTSLNPVQFNDYIIHRGDALPLLTQIHGILMLIAWIVFGGITTVIARYYRPIFPGKTLCRTSVWFQIHRAAAIVTALLTAVSFVIIFIKVYGLTNDTELHGWLGIAVMSGVTLQLIGGLVRPDHKSPYRSMFNWIHWFLGKAIFLVAVVSCFVVFDTGFLPHVQERFGTIMTAVWLGLQVVWELVFEVYKRRRLGEGNKMDESSNSSTSNILLFLYIITLLALVTLASLAIFFF